MYKALEFWTLKTAKHCKHSLKNQSSKTLEDSSAESNVDFGGPVQEVSEESNIGHWERGHTCDIFTKNPDVFCPCPNNLPEVKLKNNGLISLAKKELQDSTMLKLWHGRY